MKQVFEIESLDGISELELLGCLEENISKESWKVKEVI